MSGPVRAVVRVCAGAKEQLRVVLPPTMEICVAVLQSVPPEDTSSYYDIKLRALKVPRQRPPPQIPTPRTKRRHS